MHDLSTIQRRRITPTQWRPLATNTAATLCVLLAAALLGTGCGDGADGEADEKGLIPDCASYVSALRGCVKSIGPETERTASTQQAFALAGKDQTARDKVAAQCRAAHQRLSRACQ